MPKRQVIGVVTSDKMNKSRRVEIERLVQHPQYGKFMRRRTVCHVHDENNESHEGDTVEIIEAPPRSKLKRWDLLRIVTRCQQVDIAAMRAAAEMQANRNRRRRSSRHDEVSIAWFSRSTLTLPIAESLP